MRSTAKKKQTIDDITYYFAPVTKVKVKKSDNYQDKNIKMQHATLKPLHKGYNITYEITEGKLVNERDVYIADCFKTKNGMSVNVTHAGATTVSFIFTKTQKGETIYLKNKKEEIRLYQYDVGESCFFSVYFKLKTGQQKETFSYMVDEESNR